MEVCTNIFRRNLLLDNDILFPVGLFHEDILFMFLCSYYAKRVMYSNVPFYFYRMRNGSIMQSITSKNYMHKLFMAGRLQIFKEDHLIELCSWDSVIVALYFTGVRKSRIKNNSLYKKIRKNKKLDLYARLKMLLLPLYHLAAAEIEIEL